MKKSLFALMIIVSSLLCISCGFSVADLLNKKLELTPPIYVSYHTEYGKTPARKPVQKGDVIAANIFGKAKTVLQMIAIPMLLLNDWPFRYFDHSWPEALQISNIFFYLATIMSLISGIIYLVQNHKVLKETK